MDRLRLSFSGIVTVGISIMLVTSVAQASRLVVPPNLTLSSPAIYDTVEVNAGGTLTVNAPLTVNSVMIVRSGGVVTHSLRLEAGLVLNVTGTLDVQSGGLIDLNAKGLRGGYNGSAFGANGETYNASGQIVTGAQGTTTAYTGAGASYGGWGATSAEGRQANAPYGRLESPLWLGAGGGGARGTVGGHGGGRASITAGTLIVSGTVRCNGGAGVASDGDGGGGSGGSLKLQVGSLSGTGAIQAIGGQGICGPVDTASGAGGGGRIAIEYTTNAFPEANIAARGGTTTPNPATARYGSAGTIYLKDNAQSAGSLIVDNANVSSSLFTLLLTSLPNFGGIAVRNLGRLQAPAAYEQTGGVISVGSSCQFQSVGTLTLHSVVATLAGGTLIGTGGLALDGGTFSGVGTIQGNVMNGGSIQPGSPIGLLSVAGSYTQLATGSLSVDIRGRNYPADYDRLAISAAATLAGGIGINYTNGYVSGRSDVFTPITYSTHTGMFGTVEGVDSTSVRYLDTKVEVIGGRDLRNSTMDPSACLSPSGNVPFHVTLRDIHGLPVEGSNNVWLDFSLISGIYPCTSEPEWPIVYPQGVSGANGMIVLNVHAGGCSFGSVPVMSSHGVVAEVPIRSLDRDRSLDVTALDFHRDACSDFDDNGVTDNADWEFFSEHLGETCDNVPSAFTTLDISTSPPPQHIFQGDTIQVCAVIRNQLNVSAVLDTLVFRTAGWGIARPWSTFARQTEIELPALDSVRVCVPFIVPEAHHGCFKVSSYPNFSRAASNRAVASDYVANPDSVVYGVWIEEGEYWASIGSSDGDRFIEVPFESGPDSIYYDRVRFLGFSVSDLQEMAGLENLDQVAVIESPVFAEAADLWETGFPDFQGSEEHGLVLRRLSLDLGFARYKVTGLVPGDRSMARVREDCCHTNCGNPECQDGCSYSPDGDWVECCNAHDRCYCEGGSPYDKLVCDAELAICIALESELPPPFNPAILYAAIPGLAGWGLWCGPPAPPPPPTSDTRQLNVDTIKDPVRGGSPQGTEAILSRFVGIGDRDTTSTSIPVGVEYGDTLVLVSEAFLPESWTYSVSHDLRVFPPDTITVSVDHPAILGCSEEGWVRILAYAPGGVYAGEAELAVYPIGKRGDLNHDQLVDGQDLLMLVEYLFRFGQRPVLIETAEVTEDGMIDIADATFLSAFLFAGGANPEVCGDGPGASPDSVSVNAIWNGVTTTLSLSAPRELSGIQLELIGPEESVPRSLAGDSLELVFGRRGDTLAVALLDLESRFPLYWSYQGTTAIITIDGEFSLVGGRASDSEHRSSPIRASEMSGVLDGEPPTAPTLRWEGSNPTSGGGVIALGLPVGGRAEIGVFDIAGRRLRNLVTGMQKAGWHRVSWDGRDDSGNRLSSGLYFIRAITQDRTLRQKIVLLR